MTPAEPSVTAGLDPKDLLLADLEHFGESLLRNEEMGEKRFNFFITLVTAVAAGLITLYSSEKLNDEKLKILKDQFPTIVAYSCAGLLIVGLMSYLRILHRNHVSDEYKKTGQFIRERYAALCGGLEDYEVPVEHKGNRLQKIRKDWFKGGYAE